MRQLQEELTAEISVATAEAQHGLIDTNGSGLLGTRTHPRSSQPVGSLSHQFMSNSPRPPPAV
jgi:hypothetical protein